MLFRLNFNSPAARRWVGDDGAVRVDANGAWTVDEALAAAVAFAPFDLQYLEQPCATVPELAELRRRLDGSVLVAADESVRRAEDPLAVARAGAADLLVVKAQPLGGVAAALRIVEAAGLPVVVSSAIDTSVGLSMGAHLAAAAPGVAYACGLGTAALLAADVTAEPLAPVDGSIAVRRVDVDHDLLREHAVEAGRRSWWLERVRSAWDAAVGRTARDHCAAERTDRGARAERTGRAHGPGCTGRAHGPGCTGRAHGPRTPRVLRAPSTRAVP